ncbi:MAG TPA: polysaccharide deacetylase family protein [Gemmatimonadales bacterium]|jgi:peptidoglycan/xylan/chitin deacetylase (PgdA/CDA1 family)
MTVEAYRPSPFRQAVKAALLAVMPRSMLIGSLPAGDRSVALTFDDGPHPEWTPRILDALAARNAKATFFVIGERAERHPSLVRRLAAEGHAVGHHSWTHSEPAVTSARTLLEETRRTRALVEELTGRPAPLFRPPHGKLTAAKLCGVWWQRNAVVLWNRDPKDFQLGEAGVLVAALTERPLLPGDILLLHDVHAHTAEAMPRILAAIAPPCAALTAGR